MSSQVRQRKKPADGKQQRAEEEDVKKQQAEPVDLQPNIYVAISIVLVFAAVVGTYIYYLVDRRTNGPFATFVDNNLLPKNRYQKIM